jgi:hypothetical protein
VAEKIALGIGGHQEYYDKRGGVIFGRWPSFL